MKKKLKIQMVLVAFLATGCSVNYELDIDRGLTFKENIIIQSSSVEDIQKIQEFDRYVPINIEFDDPSVFEKKLNDVEYYDSSKNNNSTILNFHYIHKADSLNYDMFARSCYQYVTVMKQKDSKTKKDELLLSTSREFLCFNRYDDLDDVMVTITSKYKLKETNADVVEKHKYVWYINRDNADDKYLYLLLDTTERDLTLWEKIQEGKYTNAFTVSLLLLLVGGMIYLFLKRKGEKRDKI